MKKFQLTTIAGVFSLMVVIGYIVESVTIPFPPADNVSVFRLTWVPKYLLQDFWFWACFTAIAFLLEKRKWIQIQENGFKIVGIVFFLIPFIYVFSMGIKFTIYWKHVEWIGMQGATTQLLETFIQLLPFLLSGGIFMILGKKLKSSNKSREVTAPVTPSAGQP